MDTNERWVTVAAAAEALGKSERTIRRWLADGKLAVDRTGPAIVVDIARHMPATEATTPDVTELDALSAEMARLREALDTCQAERDTYGQRWTTPRQSPWR